MIDIKQNLVSKDKYNIKCPYSMKAEYITIHNTANDASAENEIAYMIRNNNQVSYHFAVDDKEVIQGIPLDRNGWHASDGQGKGNRASIAIEICYSKSGGDRFNKAEQNTAKLVGQLLKERGWGIDRVKKHQDWSGKNCPHRTINLGWDRFLDMVLAEMGVTVQEPSKPTTKYKIGDMVQLNGYLYTTSNATGKVKTAIKQGMITRIIPGAKASYLIGNSIGWIDEEGIKGGNTESTVKKSLDQLAKEVIAGKWGNGADRQARLTKAGYDAKAVQARVNKLL